MASSDLRYSVLVFLGLSCIFLCMGWMFEKNDHYLWLAGFLLLVPIPFIWAYLSPFGFICIFLYTIGMAWGIVVLLLICSLIKKSRIER